MKKYTFNIKDNKSNTTTFRTNNRKSLNDIIAADIIKKNPSLFGHTGLYNNISLDNDYLVDSDYIDDLYRSCVSDHNTAKRTTIIFNRSGLKDNAFINAANFLANYKSHKTHKYALNTIYYTADHTPVVFYEDEIQIGYDIYKYDQFDDIDFLNGLTTETKKIIINISIKL